MKSNLIFNLIQGIFTLVGAASWQRATSPLPAHLPTMVSGSTTFSMAWAPSLLFGQWYCLAPSNTSTEGPQKKLPTLKPIGIRGKERVLQMHRTNQRF
ncbi:MAG: hypothetical protein ABIX01_16065 [Chitinophagaceae bacterium]